MNNIFADLPTDLSQEVFQHLAGNSNTTIERITSRGHTTAKNQWYDQERNEWVLVLQGEAILSFGDGSKTHLKQGDYLDIAAHCKHRVEWTSPVIETLWLAVHY